MYHLRRPGLRFAGLWLLAMALQLLLWFPWRIQVLRLGLDSSYYFALNEFFVNQLQFADIVHNHGPYGFLKNDVYHPETFHLLIGVRLALFGVFALLAARLASLWAGSLRVGLLWIVLLVAVARYGEAYFLGFAVLEFLVFWSAVSVWDRVRWSPTVLALSLASLMKVTYMLMVVAIMGLMVATALLEQVEGRTREPTGGRIQRMVVALVWPVLCLTGLLLLWTFAGQDLGRLGEFVANCMRFSSSYSESHGLAGPLYRMVAYGVAGAAFWIVFALGEARRSGIRAATPVIVLGLWLLLAAKYSFLRYDAAHAGHGSFDVLTATVVFGFVMLRSTAHGEPPTGRPRAVAAIALMAAAGLLLITFDRHHWYGARFFRHLDVPTTAHSVVRFAREPSHIRNRHERALARIRRAHPLPPIDGTVDVYPWELSLAFAHRLELRPRPSLMSHSAGDPLLAAANARHLAAPDGPGHVLFRVDSIDNRYPSMDDGPSWPILLAGFRLRSAAASHLVLGRVERQCALEWSDPIARELAFGERLEVAHGFDRLLWLRADPVRTKRGGLVAAAWRAPLVYLSVELASGGERWYRLVPGAARAGFLLSPLVDDNAGFIALLDGSWPERLASDRVRALALHTEFGDGWYWEPRVRVELQELTIR